MKINDKDQEVFYGRIDVHAKYRKNNGREVESCRYLYGIGVKADRKQRSFSAFEIALPKCLFSPFIYASGSD